MTIPTQLGLSVFAFFMGLAAGCVAEVEGETECTALPSCAPGEQEHEQAADCPQDASCREVTECGVTIWCSSTEAPECAGDNPQGCVSTGCAEGYHCDTTMGTAPSACSCDPETGTWLCTADVSGGVCVECAARPSCEAGEMEHNSVSACPADASCREVTECGVTIWCSWTEAPECAGDNPQGCASTGCAEGYHCDTTMGTAPSACSCDPENGTWLCTADVSGGVCVED